ncbi:MAG: hydroxyacylglutathione hydrolase [Pseudomonadota bacterium]|jgi:hydroxyacylglutathione hydrolase
MALELITIPCLTDNYAYLIHNPDSGETALIDVPEAAPILAALAERSWPLHYILITHHHDDHIQGTAAVVAATGAQVIGAAADVHRLPPLNHQVRDGETITVCGHACHILDVSGHSIGHIAFHIPTADLVFTADSLMALGCGRLFEGTPAQAYASLMKLAALPGDPWVCSGHEYTAGNARFAATLEQDNPALISRIADVTARREKGQPTVPSRLSDERATNPYLRAHLPALKAAVGLPNADATTVFAEIRARKDRF